MEQEKVYLGDGVYASFDGMHVILRTYDGITWGAPIALDRHVLAALVLYARRIGLLAKEVEP